MKKFLLIVLASIGLVGVSHTQAEDGPMSMEHHHQNMSTLDTRTSLGVTGPMKEHQLANMRSHVDAITRIVGLISEGNFEDASLIAHAKLGLTPEMQMMCGMFDNVDFERAGRAFHQSGDALGDALQTRNVNTSLRALNTTMQHCVSCHATYRQ